MDYLVYAYLQCAQDRAAERVVGDVRSVTRAAPESFKAAYAQAAIPARYLLERRQWDEAAALELVPASFPWSNHAWPLALNAFVRCMGAARAGKAAEARRLWERLSQLLPLPQDPRFYEHMTARKTLEFTARFFFKGPQQAIDARVNEMLDLVDLSEKADRPIKSFSGGERQRLGIAQAQVNYPDLLILDEPTASLDPIGRRDVLEVMSRMRKYATIFYSTHILDDVQRVSDTVVILNHGELVAQGSIDEVLAWGQADAFSLTVKGDSLGVETRLRSQPWVTSLDEISRNARVSWLIRVSDRDLAEAKLVARRAAGATARRRRARRRRRSAGR